MSRTQKLTHILGTFIIAAVMAGGTVDVLCLALGLSCPANAYIGALGGALVCSLCAFSTLTAIIGGVFAAGAIAIWILAPETALWSARAVVSTIKYLNLSTFAAGGTQVLTLAVIAAAILSIIFFLLLIDFGTFTTLAAIFVSGATVIICCAIKTNIPLWRAVPVIVSACAAPANSAELRGSMSHIRALIPAVIAVIIAMLIAPTQGTTIKPLEDAAKKVREIYEEYFNYTQERVAFSVSDKGFDYYALKNGEPTHMLGGPANPTTDTVMKVETTDNLLLRGTVRATYTGYSWEDDTKKARHLYYDFTRLAQRKAAFSQGLAENIDGFDSAFAEVSGTVTTLSDNSSTLFVPGRLNKFDMDLKNAVYYNTVGEMFLTRGVEDGDTYSFTGTQIKSATALISLANSAKSKTDKNYADMAEIYLQLPDTIEEKVYSSTNSLIADATTDVEKVLKIQQALQMNCAYSMDVPYPPSDRDFVSYFLVDSRTGYCTYFATAMTIMCRIAGVPARYVEGYRVYANDTGTTTLTGQDAHAWCEVYIYGIGWVAFDPTPATQSRTGEPQTPEPTPTPAPQSQTPPTPTPEPETPPQGSEDEPTPTPDPESQPTPPPIAPPDDENSKSSNVWLIILIILLILALLAALIYLFYRRVKATEPAKIAAAQENADMAAMAVYRAILTLLAGAGQFPSGGESPEAFAQKVVKSMGENYDFIDFAHGITLARYSRKHADENLVQLGLSAHDTLMKQLSRTERVRYIIRRALHGIGDFTQIP